MKKGTLTDALKEQGFTGNEIKDLLLFTLNTKDRQEQMHAWLLANKDACSKEAILQQARNILQGFLASNPYNSAAKNIPAPKWEPPPVPKKPVPAVEKGTGSDREDPFDQLIRIFTGK